RASLFPRLLLFRYVTHSLTRSSLSRSAARSLTLVLFLKYDTWRPRGPNINLGYSKPPITSCAQPYEFLSLPKRPVPKQRLNISLETNRLTYFHQTAKQNVGSGPSHGAAAPSRRAVPLGLPALRVHGHLHARLPRHHAHHTLAHHLARSLHVLRLPRHRQSLRPRPQHHPHPQHHRERRLLPDNHRLVLPRGAAAPSRHHDRRPRVALDHRRLWRTRHLEQRHAGHCVHPPPRVPVPQPLRRHGPLRPPLQRVRHRRVRPQGRNVHRRRPRHAPLDAAVQLRRQGRPVAHRLDRLRPGHRQRRVVRRVFRAVLPRRRWIPGLGQPVLDRVGVYDHPCDMHRPPRGRFQDRVHEHVCRQGRVEQQALGPDDEGGQPELVEERRCVEGKNKRKSTVD
ncbi:hypothetical protein DFJ73DRAFT_207470, partial [Zopfochytrium polystomum]